jgi:glycosyltransferase involved in cell wall biosynthesis
MQMFARRQLDVIAEAGFDLISITGRGAEPTADEIPWRNIALGWPIRDIVRRLSPYRYISDLKAFSRLVTQVIDRVRPHLVYSEGPLIHDYLQREDRSACTVFNPHGLEMFQSKGSWVEDMKSWPLRSIVADHAMRADLVVSLSRGGQLMRILRHRIGVPADRIVVLPNAAPKPLLPSRTAPNRRPVRFLFVGRDEARKGLPLLLRAIAAVGCADLDVVGVSKVSRSARVRYHGSVKDRAVIDQFYAEADYLVAPSYAEGMPTVILEAFAAGIPVIATDVGANSDMVQTGNTGFLVPRNDQRALILALKAAMTLDDASYAALSRACTAAASGPFSADTARQGLLSLLGQARKVA